MNAVTFIVDSVLNTLWQSAIVVGAVWIGLRFSLTRLNAATRYVIWGITLIVVLALPWIHRPRSAPEPLPRPTATALQHALPAQVPAPFASPVPETFVAVTSQRTAKWPLWVFAIWLLVFTWQVFRMTCSYLYLRGVKRRATAQDYSLPDIGRKVRLLVSTEITSPMAVGFRRPAVLIPEHLREQLNPEQFHGVVLHECAHIARYDDWLNIAGRTV